MAYAAAVLFVSTLPACSKKGEGTTAAGCDALYKHYFAPCFLAGYPTNEVTRVQARWDTYCESLASLPGSTVTSSALEACASAYAVLGCNSAANPPACAPLSIGTLMGGASCVQDNQCLSGTCDVPVTGDGGEASGCGMCDTLVGLGGACGAAGTSCGPNATCGGTCVAIDNEAGADAGADAGPGVGLGGACDGADAGFCSDGLACGSAGTCVVPTYADAGAPCDLMAMGCLVGTCNGASDIEGDDGGSVVTPGTCPAVIADGQPCDPNSETTTCDTLATCLNGTCVLAQSDSLCR
jgi:hypothetical protein